MSSEMLKYSKEKPTKPGWYWCRNRDPDSPSGEWEGIVRVEGVANVVHDGRGGIEISKGGLAASWMTAPGRAGVMMESEWSDGCMWAGPIHPPEA